MVSVTHTNVNLRLNCSSCQHFILSILSFIPSFLIFDAPMIIHKKQRCLLTDTHMYVPLEPNNETPEPH